MIQICFNEETITIHPTTTLTELLIQQQYTQEHFAVAVNQTFIAKRHHPTTLLKEGDRVVLISPMQGG